MAHRHGKNSSKAAPVSSEPESLLVPRAHLSRSRLYGFQQVRHCPSEGPGSSEQVLPTAHLVIHEGRQQLHTLGHLRQVGRNGGDCTSHSCVVGVCRVTWDREKPSPSKESGEAGGEPSGQEVNSHVAAACHPPLCRSQTQSTACSQWDE